MPSTYYVAWWNLENLFDEEKSPRRTEKLQRTLGKDIAGWTPARPDRKVSQLSSVIAQMNNGLGADLLGVCEVENRHVRGIDVAFLYDRGSHRPGGQGVLLCGDAAKRDARARPGQVRDTREPHLDGVRQPLAFTRRRPRAQPATEISPARRSATTTNARSKSTDKTTPALAVGDFNDEPFDTSLVIHALSTRQRQRVVDADNPLFWNLSWAVIGDPADGSFYFNNEPNLLDQVLVNKNTARQDSPIRAKPDTLQILRFPGTFSGKYKRPKPFGGMRKPVDEEGYSDRFPVGLQITEAD